jgi:hypothetical protein
VDEYEIWLKRQARHWHLRCLFDAASIGYPGKARFASVTLREIADAYDDCLQTYIAMKQKDHTP